MKNGFTMAEVLVTLGIIGIVASMTMPGLIKKHKRVESETRLKKAYSTISQAFLTAQASMERQKTGLSGKQAPKKFLKDI